jgi:hypothetical protein
MCGDTCLHHSPATRACRPRPRRGPRAMAARSRCHPTARSASASARAQRKAPAQSLRLTRIARPVPSRLGLIARHVPGLPVTCQASPRRILPWPASVHGVRHPAPAQPRSQSSESARTATAPLSDWGHDWRHGPAGPGRASGAGLLGAARFGESNRAAGTTRQAATAWWMTSATSASRSGPWMPGPARGPSAQRAAPRIRHGPQCRRLAGDACSHGRSWLPYLEIVARIVAVPRRSLSPSPVIL